MTTKGRIILLLMSMQGMIFLSAESMVVFGGGKSDNLLPIPDKLVVLTFDDGNASDYAFTVPILKEYGFNASFFIVVESWIGGIGDPGRMTWDQVKALADDEFEIGSHGYSHAGVIGLPEEAFRAELTSLERACIDHGVPAPVTFAYPAGHMDGRAVEVLVEEEYWFARRGVDPEFPVFDNGGLGYVYEPDVEHPLLVPSTIVPGPGAGMEEFITAVEQARDGKIPILTFHGIPDKYPWCSNTPEQFREYMKYLHDNDYKVIALQDLAKYVDPKNYPEDMFGAIQSRLGVTPVELRCEYLVDPLGIDTVAARFSWILESVRRDQEQAAYQILVASSREKLDQNIGDIWDSGKVVSSRSVNVPYEGPVLQSATKYWWKVRCWNKPGYDGTYASEGNIDPSILELMRKEKEGVYSAAASFETGLLNGDLWQGKWIASPDAAVSAPLLRKEFRLAKDVKSARLYICGLGWHELYLNGEKVGDHQLDPATTYYHNDQPYDLGSRALYVTHNVTDNLKTGQNALGVMLGNGWYSLDPGTQSHFSPFKDRPELLLQLNVEFVDGESLSIVSNSSWKSSNGPITANSIVHGETYNALREKPGWISAGYDDTGWDRAQEVPGPGGTLKAQMLPPAKIIDTIQPAQVYRIAKNVDIYDFGQHFSGWSRITVSGPKGAKVKLIYAGRVNDDHTLDTRNNLDADQTDYYTLKGQGDEVWEPRFTLHGFQYVEITRLDDGLTIKNLEGRFVRNSVETAGEFSCSNNLINNIHKNICWTFMSSFQGIPQDAAERYERVAWLGDPGFIAEDCIVNFNTASFWSKWLNDIKDSQRPDGDLPVISPLHYRAGYWMWPCWKSTYPLIAWYVYQYYDDTRVLQTHYDGMKALLAFFEANMSDYLLLDGLGDHMEPQPGGTSSMHPQHTPAGLTSTAYFYYDAWILAQAAQILGKAEDAQYYSELADNIKTAFNETFLDTRSNQYASGSQTSNALPLYLGMVPEDRQGAVVQNLVNDINLIHNGHLSTGIIGANALEQALPMFDRAETMYTIATKTTWPSWGYQIANGATSLWETFEISNTHSLNMKMFGSVEKFFYGTLAGITPAAPGYKVIIVKPHVVGDLTSAKASITTVRGLASVDWEKTDTLFKMKVIVPVNSIAEVFVPKMGQSNITITENLCPLWADHAFTLYTPGITAGLDSGDYIKFDVGSGSYVFAAELTEVVVLPTPTPPIGNVDTYTETFNSDTPDLGIASSPSELYKWHVSAGYTLDEAGLMVDNSLQPGSLVIKIPGDVDFTVEGTMVLPNGLPNDRQIDIVIRDNNSADSDNPFTDDPAVSGFLYMYENDYQCGLHEQTLGPSMTATGYDYDSVVLGSLTTPITYRVKLMWINSIGVLSGWYSLDGSGPSITMPGTPLALGTDYFNDYNNIKEVGFETWQVTGAEWSGFPVCYDSFSVSVPSATTTEYEKNN